MAGSTGIVDNRANWRDYIEMSKPRVVLLMLVCALVGMFLATPDFVPLNTIVFGLTGIALVAASAAALNHLVDATIDAKMARTHNRPVAQGRVDILHAKIFIAATGLAGMMILTFLVNPLTAWLNAVPWHW